MISHLSRTSEIELWFSGRGTMYITTDATISYFPTNDDELDRLHPWISPYRFVALSCVLIFMLKLGVGQATLYMPCETLFMDSPNPPSEYILLIGCLVSRLHKW